MVTGTESLGTPQKKDQGLTKMQVHRLWRHGGPRPKSPEKMERARQALGPRKNEGGLWREAETGERRQGGGRGRQAERSTEKKLGKRLRVRRALEKARETRDPSSFPYFLLSIFIEHLLCARNFPGSLIRHETKQRKLCLQEITFYKRKNDNKEVKYIEC